MKFRVLLALFFLLTFFAFAVNAHAQDSTEQPQPVVEATEATPVVDEMNTDAPVTVINNNGFSFEQVFVLICGFVLTIFAGARMFLMPALKANAELAKAAGDYVPQETFNKVIGVTEGLQQWAKTLTPNWTGDDEGLSKLRQEFEDWKNLLHPTTPRPENDNPARGESPDTLAAG